MTFLIIATDFLTQNKCFQSLKLFQGDEIGG